MTLPFKKSARAIETYLKGLIGREFDVRKNERPFTRHIFRWLPGSQLVYTQELNALFTGLLMLHIFYKKEELTPVIIP